MNNQREKQFFMTLIYILQDAKTGEFIAQNRRFVIFFPSVKCTSGENHRKRAKFPLTGNENHPSISVFHPSIFGTVPDDTPKKRLGQRVSARMDSQRAFHSPSAPGFVKHFYQNPDMKSTVKKHLSQTATKVKFRLFSHASHEYYKRLIIRHIAPTQKLFSPI